MRTPPDATVVIPSWNTRELLERCLETLLASGGVELEVRVVDNGSSDGSAEMVSERFPSVQLLRNEENRGFAIACNQGMRGFQGRHVLLLNTDTETPPGGVARLVEFLDTNPAYGAVAPRLVYPDGRTQRLVHEFPTLRTALFFGTPLQRWFPEARELRRYFKRDWDPDVACDLDQPPAAVLLLRGEALRQVGLFDERLWLFYNDVDLSLRMKRAGWRTRYLAEVAFVHHHGSSTERFETFVSRWQQDRLLYYRKHYGLPGAAWLKLCVGWTFADFALRQLWARWRRTGGEPVRPLAREFLRFLRL